MPRLFVTTGDLVGPRLTLAGEAHRYLTRVLRLGAGATVDLYDGRGLEVAATIARAGSREVTLDLGERRHVARRPTPPVTLLQGLPRAERMDLVIQKAAELGAARVVPVRTDRSAAGQQPKQERWDKIAREAARQSGRPDLPTIAPMVGLPQAIAGIEAAAARIVPWEEAVGAPPLARAVPAAPAAVALLIGPEGGLTSAEVTLATQAGFQVVTLGPRILRTETAAIVALAIVQSLVGGLD
ncbi:MAG: 16S rRNA (uracil(1498)-N(3))-methyltransferase [Haliangium ochraceum]